MGYSGILSQEYTETHPKIYSNNKTVNELHMRDLIYAFQSLALPYWFTPSLSYIRVKNLAELPLMKAEFFKEGLKGILAPLSLNFYKDSLLNFGLKKIEKERDLRG